MDAAEVIEGEPQRHGCPVVLPQHLYALMGLQRACNDGAWKQFHDMVQRAFPKKGDTVPFTFKEGEPIT